MDEVSFTKLKKRYFFFNKLVKNLGKFHYIEKENASVHSSLCMTDTQVCQNCVSNRLSNNNPYLVSVTSIVFFSMPSRHSGFRLLTGTNYPFPQAIASL